jgi:hypothetical protein
MTLHLAAVGLCVATSLPAFAQSTLIPIPDRRDHVFDAVNNVLFISTESDRVERFDHQSASLLQPWISTNANSLNGIDVSPDGSTLYVAEDYQGASTGRFRVFNTDTGNHSDARYLLANGEGQSWDVVATNSNFALTTTDYRGSGNVPMRQLFPETLTFSDEIRNVRHQTHLYRSADAGTVFYTESDSSAGRMGIYDVDSENFISERGTGSNNTASSGGISRNGKLVAIELHNGVTFYDKDFQIQADIFGFNGGIGFSPVADIVFLGIASTDEIVALDTNSFTEIARYTLSDDLVEARPFGGGVMSFSGDGQTLFVSTANGVSMLAVVPAPASSSLLFATGYLVRRKRK